MGHVLADLQRGRAVSGEEYTFEHVRRELELTGVSLLRPGEVAPVEAGVVLVVPNEGLVGKLFEGTVWGGELGQAGTWKDALR